MHCLSENQLNKKIYIGKTKFTLEERKKQHLQKINSVDTVFYRALRKYGQDKFLWKVLYKAKKSEAINKLEIFFIDKLQSHISKKGYNTTFGGEGGDTLSNNPNIELIKRKLSLKFSGKNNPMYGTHRTGKDSPFYGKTHSQEFKLKLSRIHKGKIISTGTRNKMSLALKGQKKTEDHKNKIALSHKGIKPNLERKMKLSKAAEIYVYELISPMNKIFMVSNLNKFCKSRNLSQPCMQRLVTNKIIKNEYKGWKGRIVSNIEKEER